MSRSGYVDAYGDDDLAMGRWMGVVASAARGQRGQSFLRDLIEALDAMPVKRLIKEDLRKDGEVCALGALGAKKGLDLESLDPEDYDVVAKSFNIAAPLVQETVFMNDEFYYDSTPEKRWEHIRKWAQGLLNKCSK